MSASREKKMRQQSQSTAPTTQTEKKKTNSKTVLYSVIAVAVVILVAFFTLINTNFFESHTKVAAVGERKLTGAEVNYWLMDTYSQEQSNPSFTALVDVNLPLNEQDCPEEGYDTWYDYMLKMALEAAANTYAVYDKAVAEGFTMSETGKTSIDAQMQMLEMYAPMYGFANANTYLSAMYGKGCKLSSYKEYLTVTTVAQEYEASVQAAMSFSQEELDAYYAEHANENDIVRFRVFNVPVDAEANENGETVTTNEDAMAMADAVRAGGEDAFLAEAEARIPEDQRATYDAETSTLSNFMTVADAQEKYNCDEFASETLAAGDVFMSENESGTFVFLVLGKITKDNKLPNVRHILIQPEAGEDGSISAEAWDAAYAEADAVLKEYLEGEQTEEAFGALANAKTTDTGSAETGGLYEKIEPMQMVAPFANWCFSATEAGQTGIVKTSYGYHVMYFCGESDVVYGDTVSESKLREEAYNNWIAEIEGTATYELTSKKYINVI